MIDGQPRLRVVELADGVAGPSCGRLFAALGDEVVKLERGGGDPLRVQPPLDSSGLGLSFTALNSGKSSLLIDRMTDDEIDELLATADVYVVGGPDETLSARLGAEAVRRRHPRLVVVSITAFGLSGDYSGRWGDSLLAESYGGMASMVGDPGARPLSLGGEQAAHAAGAAGFLGASVALAGRERTGEGELVDVAMCDVAAYMDWKSDIALDHTSAVPTRVGASTGRWRLVRASDGYVGIIYMPEQWPTLCALIGDPVLTDPRFAEAEDRDRHADEIWPVIEGWAAELPAEQIYHRAQAMGLPFGYTAGAGPLVGSPQYASRGFLRGAQRPRPGHPIVGGLFDSDVLQWSQPAAPDLGGGIVPSWAPRPPVASSGATSAPLAGLRVLDFGTITAGAATGRLLADYGASVVKVESPAHPDPFRYWSFAGAPPLVGSAPVFESNNAGKMAVSLDLGDADAREQLYALVRQADVLVENFRVGVTRKLGIDFETVHRINPDLLYMSLSSQGQTGPEATYRSYGSTLDLMSGLAEVTGYPGGAPLWSSAELNYPDQLVSLLAAGLVAYRVRTRGDGGYIDLAQREVVTWTLSAEVADHVLNGTPFVRSGNHRPGVVPHEVFATDDDSWIALACRTDAQRASIAYLIDAPGLAETPSEEAWRGFEDDIDARIASWVGSRSERAALAELDAAGVPAVPVLDARRRRHESRFADRGVFLSQPQRLKGQPFVLQGRVPATPALAPVLGEHTVEDVLDRWQSLPVPTP